MGVSHPIHALNRQAAASFGWSPGWFGVSGDEWGAPLAHAIARFQRLNAIEVDGYCGDATFRRALTRRILDGSEVLDPLPQPEPADQILVGGELVAGGWHTIATPGEQGALVLGDEDFGRRERKLEELRAVVIHWDATSSAQATHRVLDGRGLSTHFVVDWDGTVYQLGDVTRTAWHAKGANRYTIGIDINTPVGRSDVEDVNRKLERLGQVARPVVDDVRINGWYPGRFLGAHAVQLEALAALLGALERALPELRLKAHTDNPKRVERLAKVSESKLRGVYHHAEVDFAKRGKWDTAGVDLHALVESARA